jgi:hypothetical protein
MTIFCIVALVFLVLGSWKIGELVNKLFEWIRK